ncbi:MAG: hypothetical protein LBK06_09320 [Planctomycetaceae bacterium]|nr:hypothetical protein [Planctomycetaceae bacterium]
MNTSIATSQNICSRTKPIRYGIKFRAKIISYFESCVKLRLMYLPT